MAMPISTSEINQSSVNQISPHQVITLLLDGAMDRIDKSIVKVKDGDVDTASELIHKTIDIVAGLRESLNKEAGGDLASNLELLYDYIQSRLYEIGTEDEPILVLTEIRDLLNEVYSGWIEIAEQVED